MRVLSISVVMRGHYVGHLFQLTASSLTVSTAFEFSNRSLSSFFFFFANFNDLEMRISFLTATNNKFVGQHYSTYEVINAVLYSMIFLIFWKLN